MIIQPESVLDVFQADHNQIEYNINWNVWVCVVGDSGHIHAHTCMYVCMSEWFGLFYFLLSEDLDIPQGVILWYLL